MLKPAAQKMKLAQIGTFGFLAFSWVMTGCQLDPGATGGLASLTESYKSDAGQHSSSRDDDDHESDHHPSGGHCTDDHHEDETLPIALPASSPQSGDSCFSEQFRQPEQQITRSVDILFVADTSRSMDDNRRKVADGITSLIRELPEGSDFRIGIMLSHGSRSPYAGRLWRIPNRHSLSAHGHPYVLSSQQVSASNLKGRMRAMMASARDYQFEQGESGLYSFMEALKPAKFAESQARGFFRPEAALAVVFISDENDTCAVYPTSVNGMPGMTDAERIIRQRDCPNGISAQEVVSAAKAIKGEKPVIFGAVIHNEAHQDHYNHESFGWGYNSVVSLSQGVTLDIAENDYSDGLEMVGQLIRSRLELITSRVLEHSPVDEATIQIRVDGVTQNGTFAPATNEVHFAVPGSAGSLVELNYCLQSQTGGGGTGGSDPGTGGGTGGSDPGTGGGTGGSDPGGAIGI